jgi:tetratricopeptide (TPR) repeat protein
MELLRQVIIVSACLTVAAGAASPAGAQTQQQIDWCVNEGNTFSPDLSIGGCTAAIQSGRWSGKDLEWAFNNRCRAYSEKNETDRAMADCTDAIRLDPNDGVAYLNRGDTYRDMEDYDRATADFNEAARLKPN